MEIKICRKIIIALFFMLTAGGILFSKESKDEVTVVKILNAEKTGNKKSDLDGTDMIVLEGNVSVSVKKGDVTTTINADTINYNREKDMLYAEGNVKLQQSGGSSEKETVTAENLLFNTSTLEGIFDGGRIVQTSTDSINLPSGSTLVVASDIFGRDDSGTITFKNGSLTFCDEDPPHWKIKASRIWLLPGGEFAFFNAFLYVGKVPVLYLPAFWYPKDELVFNPVFGFRQREGYFFQTTTYIFGRKPLSAYDVEKQYNSSEDDSESEGSYFNFVKPSKLKDQERQGLMLHNLDSDYKGNTTSYAKIMADWYASLGYMLGIDSVIKPSNKYISDFEFNFQLGVSNTIFQYGGVYSPYGQSSAEMYSDSSNFLGLKNSFRYKGNLKLDIANPLSLSLSMPIYSDPYFTTDFGNRNETMDWIDYLISNPNTEVDAQSDSDRENAAINSFKWQLSGSYNVPLPEDVRPYVDSLSVSSFSSSVLFSSLVNSKVAATTDADGWKNYTPERKFFYPSQVKPLDFSVKLSGTIFELDSNSKNKSVKNEKKLALISPENLKAAGSDSGAEKKNSAQGDSSVKSDGEGEKQSLSEKGPSTAAEGSETAADSEKNNEQILSEKLLPDLAFTVPQVSLPADLAYKLTYSISPAYVSEFSYSSTGLESPEDFDWNRMRSTMVNLKVPTTLTSTFGYKGSFLGITDSFNFNPVYQNHPYLSTDTAYGGYTQENINNIKKTDYSARKLDLSNSNVVSLKPFYYTDHFKETGLSWNTTVQLIRTEFIGDADHPEWEYLTTDLTDEECVTVHTLNAVLASTQYGGDFGQKLELSSTLPPQTDRYYGTMTFTFPYTTLIMETGVKQKSKTDETWEKEPFKQSLAFKFFNGKIGFTESYTYNREDEYSDALKYSLSVYDFQLAYTAKYTNGYSFDSTGGWTAKSDKEFQPYSLSLAYAKSKKNFHYWKNRITWAPSLSSSLVYDYIQPTNSYFKFIPAITLRINEFLDIEFSSSSRNDVIYRYFQDHSSSEARIAGETNWFKDLADSFRFDDEDKRLSSGFKLESFNIKISHALHDWDFSSQFKIEPRLVTESSGKKYYDYSPFFTVSVVWRPMAGMKTKIQDKYGDWELNP
ncbi:MAG: hypothetical protein K5640_01875 [Treponema sp.]|nr:hypothetical protein [Treponema sp.]